ncbi:MAG TPA: hypothetical protein V6D34_06160 [Candidatus Sericytochromatia bacterium]|jgi:hypothetical protein
MQIAFPQLEALQAENHRIALAVGRTSIAASRTAQVGTLATVLAISALAPRWGFFVA